MSSSNTFSGDITAVVNASMHGTALGSSNDAVSRDAIEEENSKSRAAALMKAFKDYKELHDSCPPSQSMVTKFPHAVEITDHVKAAIGGDVDQQLIPPFGTKGFQQLNAFIIFQAYQIEGTDWIVNVYAYRHAESNNVTVIVIHSGRTSDGQDFGYYTTPATPNNFYYPDSLDSKVGTDMYSYHIDDERTFNMIGPDGKNPIVVQTVYKEKFIAPAMYFLHSAGMVIYFWTDTTEIHGMTVFDASFEVGTSFFIEFLSATDPDTVHSGKVEIKV
ncbi:hypothetical protein BDP27DRAFT_1431464 [Rhodocollybia butyracea]|uniref:Uncharacterized protein n=1 Tax=Rhodocollybia butyracea TaxID=206335 RepID=A0A9P5P9Q6_9AGAR|nr:hypothetical protein BDP27DRAFT_1431464 [Rhodocollybia butyracea]